MKDHKVGALGLILSSFLSYTFSKEMVSATTYKRVHYMVQDPLEVGAIFSCIFTSPHIVEPLLLDARGHKKVESSSG